MSSRIVLLAALGLGLGMTGKASADIAPPLPANKDSVKVKIEVDENAKAPRLIVPSGVFTAPRGRPKLAPPDAPKGELPQEDGDGIAQEETQPRNHILIAGIALSLSMAFGGLWLMRRNGRGSMRAMTLLIAAGATLTAGAIVYANAPPPIKDRPQPVRPPASYPTAWEGGTKVEFTYGQEPVRLILDKESYKKLLKGELTVEKLVPNSPAK